MTDPFSSLAQTLGARLTARRQRLACAESCTGGWIAKLVTDVAGASDWFERGVVVYSNQAKQELLGVPETLLARHGAVSSECARAMAAGLLARGPADWAVAVTGVAGPSGGTKDKPVGLVWIAFARRGALPETRRFQFTGGRDTVRRLACEAALHGLIERLDATTDATVK